MGSLSILKQNIFIIITIIFISVTIINLIIMSSSCLQIFFFLSAGHGYTENNKKIHLKRVALYINPSDIYVYIFTLQKGEPVWSDSIEVSINRFPGCELKSGLQLFLLLFLMLWLTDTVQWTQVNRTLKWLTFLHS